MSNLVPEGWKMYALGKLADVRSSNVDKKIEDGEKLVQLCNYTDVYYNHRISKKINFMLASAKEREIERFTLKAGDVIFTKDSETPNDIAIPCYVPDDLDGVLCGYHLTLLRPDKKKCNGEYLSHLFQLESVRHHFYILANGITRFGLTSEGITSAPMCMPAVKEQQKIAAILTSVDDGIEKTQAQINKLKDLKTGMMQELLTRGVGVDGKPHTEFKDSPVGRIPKGWDVKSLGDLSSFITSGSRGWAQYYSESGAIFIRIGNLTREHINFRFKDIIRVSPPESAEGKRTLVQAGDVLISITADLGVIAVVNESLEKAYVNQHVALVRLKDIAISRWVGHYLAFEQTQKQFSANNDSGAKAGLNLTAIRNTVVTLPSESEILSIVKSLDSIDDLIFKKRNKLVTLNSTKKALMQDLLTGKVRVNVE
ncbi:restriction endonuclease subunit S [Photobacterium carnosum]|uniref:restriction endonuclease subunit S n=1 Tax=Photobacterium carnosum TaxID=2023717 RepID=UPI001E3F8EE9|nr:restriction endonuclease subunit S [Photobacterium carnosum]MCD9522132.1 restriction endonuclease subunit S [Photobacterium carnosum]